jgi:hypothetical protein
MKKSDSTNLLTAGIFAIALILLFAKFRGKENNALLNEDELHPLAKEISPPKPDPKEIWDSATNAHEASKQNSPAIEQSPSQQDPDIQTIEAFKRFTQQTLEQLPTKQESLAHDPAEAHGIPRSIVQAGVRLGQIREILAKHPEWESEAANFYEICARNEPSMTSVRALCLANFIQWKRKQGEELDLSQFPPRVVELTDGSL